MPTTPGAIPLPPHKYVMKLEGDICNYAENLARTRTTQPHPTSLGCAVLHSGNREVAIATQPTPIKNSHAQHSQIHRIVANIETPATRIEALPSE